MTKLTATIGGGKSTRVSPFALDSLVTGATTLRSMIEEAMRDAKRIVRRLRARRRERRRLQSTYNELRALDDHTLRDLGFHRDELMSVAAEVSGAAERTRTRVQLQSYLFP